MLDWEHGIDFMPCRVIGHSVTARGKYHGFSRVAVGIWHTFPSYGGDGH